MWDWYKKLQRIAWNWVVPGSGDLVWGSGTSNDPLGIYGQYGDSPTVQGEEKKSWFQKIWQTIVTVILVIILVVVLLLIFKGYKFVSQIFKLKS